MAKRSSLIDGLWCGALALAAVAAAGDLVPWMTDMASQLAALVQGARA